MQCLMRLSSHVRVMHPPGALNTPSQGFNLIFRDESWV